MGIGNFGAGTTARSPGHGAENAQQFSDRIVLVFMIQRKGQPMNVQAEKPELTDEDKNLAAVSDVEAGIRDFVRKDIAYLRRPSTSASPPSSTEPMDSLAEATVNNVNTLIQRVAGASLQEIETLISELEGLRNLMH